MERVQRSDFRGLLTRRSRNYVYGLARNGTAITIMRSQATTASDEETKVEGVLAERVSKINPHATLEFASQKILRPDILRA